MQIGNVCASYEEAALGCLAAFAMLLVPPTKPVRNHDDQVKHCYVLQSLANHDMCVSEHQRP